MVLKAKKDDECQFSVTDLLNRLNEIGGKLLYHLREVFRRRYQYNIVFSVGTYARIALKMKIRYQNGVKLISNVEKQLFSEPFWGLFRH